GQSTENLKISMREQTSRIKSISSEIGKTESRILGYFDLTHVTRSTTPASPPGNASSYRSTMAASDVVDSSSITLLKDEQYDWNTYVEHHPAASIYHLAEWRELTKKTFGHEGFYFIARNDEGNITGILPLIRLKSRVFGDFMVSLPYFNYGGPIADHPLIEQALIDAANTLAATTGVTHVEYRDKIPRENLTARTEKVNMILKLPDNVDSLWESFGSKLRNQIRRPQRQSPEIHIGGKTCLEDFYAVFSRNMRDLGTPVYGKVFFSNILDCFTPQSRIIDIRLHGKPVAAAFLLGYRNTLEIPWASTIREVNHLSINMLLYWEVLKFAVVNNYTYFDFGRSSKDSGTYRFKRQWGAQPKQLYWHYWLNTGQEIPLLNPDNPRYAMAIRIWQHLPLKLTNWLGPKIVKNIP
ncbi:MAG: FemAB family XrtA/PEP-CTERM system-associated protein, partial [Gammaproteobacteria bacterium]